MPGKSKRQHEELAEREAALARKDQFFMAASHQLKAPVAIIQWCLQSVLENDATDRKTKEMVRKALSQANAMSSLIADMLHVFRLQRQKGKESFVPVDVNRLVDEVLVQVEVAAHNRGIHIVRGPLEQLPSVWAEPGYMKQAILNLVDNAIKYSPEGGAVTVTTREKRGCVEIEVADQGIGMAEADLHRLFTEFFRSVQAQSMTHEGTGLGLVLVKQIVEEFGGEIDVKSRLGKGSTFTIKLPVHHGEK